MCVYGNSASVVGIWVWKKQDFLRGDMDAGSRGAEGADLPPETRHYQNDWFIRKKRNTMKTHSRERKRY